MDLTYTQADEAFRAKVTEFIARQLPVDWRGWGALDRPAYDTWAENWRNVLLEAGWLAPAWPKEYGGGGLSVSEQSLSRASNQSTSGGARGKHLPRCG